MTQLCQIRAGSWIPKRDTAPLPIISLVPVQAFLRSHDRQDQGTELSQNKPFLSKINFNPDDFCNPPSNSHMYVVHKREHQETGKGNRQKQKKKKSCYNSTNFLK